MKNLIFIKVIDQDKSNELINLGFKYVTERMNHERLLQALSKLGESLQDPERLQLCSERKVASHTPGMGGGQGP